jgi:hypothetical protein
MRKKLVLEILSVLSIAVYCLTAFVSLTYADPVTQTEHLSAGLSVVIDVPGHPKIAVVAMHMDKSDFYGGSADRINLFVATGLAPPKPPSVLASAYEDNPERKAFSDQVGGGAPGTRPLVNKWQIQIFKIGKTVFMYWTIPLNMPATTLTPEVVLPPGALVLQGSGEAQVNSGTVNFPSGWKMTSQTTSYDAKATFICPSWCFCGSPSTAAAVVQTDGTSVWAHA